MICRAFLPLSSASLLKFQLIDYFNRQDKVIVFEIKDAV
jgi:hypothetical protein